MAVVIDLNSRRKTPIPFNSLSHPAGVNLPFDAIGDAELIIPEIRNRICSGSYSSELLRVLDSAVQPGDRVLVIGAGLGTASTVVAKRPGVKRVIAVEANTELCRYLKRTHELNDVAWVETVNAVLGSDRRGRIPFFARYDIRSSSLLCDECSWQRVMVVPAMDINLIVAEERISLMVCEIPSGGAELLSGADLGPVDRILVSSGDDELALGEEREVLAVLAEKGFEAEKLGSTLMFGRIAEGREGYLRAGDSA